MSRSSYSDDYGDEFPGQINLYRANVRRSMQSKAGQARLRELREALLALPVKELEADIFADGTREQPKVCALGAWAWWKQRGDPQAAKAMVPPDPDDADTATALAPRGWPRLVVFDLVYENDEPRYVYETFEGPRRTPYGRWPVQYPRQETPVERYTRILAWVEGQIVDTGNPMNGAVRGVGEGD